MQPGIIQVYQGKLKIGTWDLSQGSKIQHRLLKKVIEKNPHHFDYTIPKLIRHTKKKGGQIDEYLLNEGEIRILFAHLLNHSRIKMGLSACIFKTTDTEMQFLKMLEDYFEETRKL